MVRKTELDKGRLVRYLELDEADLKPAAAGPTAVPSRGKARWTCQLPTRGGRADEALKRLKHSARLYYTLASGLSR